MLTGSSLITRVFAVIVLGIVTGSLASLAAILFVDMIAVLNDWLLISPRSRIMTADTHWLLIATLCIPALGGLVVGLIHLQLPERRPGGPVDIIRTVQASDGRVPLKSGLLTALSSLVSLGAGASVGQYGPLAYLGATLGSLVGGVGNVSRWTIRVGVGCGVAAAISTAFGAPIAGIIFAHEVILRHYSLRAFAPITVASTVGHVVATVIFERPPLFRVEAVHVNHAPEFLGFILIGILGALVAVAFMRGILLANRLAAGISIPSFLKPMLAGAALGAAALWIPEILGIGTETLRFAIIDQAFEPTELAILIVAKIAATALCLGFGFAGGVFSPALLIGILFGALAANGADMVLGDLRSDIAIYAICGMVAVTSAVIGAPLTTILIVFELTRNYDLTTAAMVSVVFSNLVSYRIFGRSLFDVQLGMAGFDLSLGRDKVMLENTTIDDYVTRDFTSLEADMSLSDARTGLLSSRRHEGYVLDRTGTYLGKVKLEDLLTREQQGLSSKTPVKDIADRDSLVFRSGTSVWTAMEEVSDFVGESVPVIGDEPEGLMVGVVFEATLIRAYLDMIYENRREEHAA